MAQAITSRLSPSQHSTVQKGLKRERRVRMRGRSRRNSGFDNMKGPARAAKNGFCEICFDDPDGR